MNVAIPFEKFQAVMNVVEAAKRWEAVRYIKCKRCRYDDTKARCVCKEQHRDRIYAEWELARALRDLATWDRKQVD